MSNLFSGVLNMSMTGSVVILIVMLARLILKRSPKIFSYALWSVVLFRLLCPVAFTAPVSVLNAFEAEVKPSSESTSIVYYIPAQVEQPSEFTFVSAENQSGRKQDREVVSNQTELDIMTVFSGVWITGVAVMLLYSAAQYVLLKRKLVGNILYRGNVYLADYIDTPFVLGIFRPKVYLPTNVPSNERKYIIAHERHHIRRCDHIIKLLAYCALCIHWFNPLVWAAFILAGKDMEMSCDEAVIKQLGTQIRADYSVSLLRLATHKKIIAGMPLAFGEGDTKGRVINMAKWKKPKLWVSLICFVLCAVILVACAVNPSAEESMDPIDTSMVQAEPQAGFDLVFSGELMPVVKGSDIATDTELVQYGTLKLLLGSGFEAREQDGAIVLVKDSVDIGGITCYSHPGFEPDDMMKWIRALGLPELKEDFGVPIGYMAGGSSYGGLEIEIFQDGNPEELNEEHVFFIDGNIVYDVWYDQNLITDGIAERFLKTITINEEPVVEVDPDEQPALAKCRTVIEAVQNGSCQLLIEQKNGGNQGPSGYMTTYCRDDSNWLSITEMLLEGTNVTDAGEYYNRQALMHVNDTYYSNEGHWGEQGEINWSEGGNDVWLPWLVKFVWNENVVAYMDTLTDENGECVMLRVDEQYIDSDEYDPHYFVNFNFDPEGNFVNVELEVNLFRENELEITESIVTLDSETVNAEIQAEYQKAIG